MPIAEIVHSLGAPLFIAAIIAHTYIASISMEGGFDAMADGIVDLNGAKQHRRSTGGGNIRKAERAAQHAAHSSGGRPSL
jgi:cytochrome b subunit of formate dehydrogenase